MSFEDVACFVGIRIHRILELQNQYPKHNSENSSILQILVQIIAVHGL